LKTLSEECDAPAAVNGPKLKRRSASTRYRQSPDKRNTADRVMSCALSRNATPTRSICPTRRCLRILISSHGRRDLPLSRVHSPLRCALTSAVHKDDKIPTAGSVHWLSDGNSIVRLGDDYL